MWITAGLIKFNWYTARLGLILAVSLGLCYIQIEPVNVIMITWNGHNYIFYFIISISLKKVCYREFYFNLDWQEWKWNWTFNGVPKSFISCYPPAIKFTSKLSAVSEKASKFRSRRALLGRELCFNAETLLSGYDDYYFWNKTKGWRHKAFEDNYFYIRVRFCDFDMLWCSRRGGFMHSLNSKIFQLLVLMVLQGILTLEF